MYDYFLQFPDEVAAIAQIGSHIPPAPYSAPLYQSGAWRPDISIKCSVAGQTGFFIWIATTVPDPILQFFSLFAGDCSKIKSGSGFITTSNNDTALTGFVFTPVMAGRAYPLGKPAMLAGKVPDQKRTAFYGTNLSGAEFGTVPGTLNVDYAFPTLAEAAYYASKGMNIVRLPFLWERIQPVFGGALDPVHLNWLLSFAKANPSLNVLLDLHNYAQYNGKFIAVDGPTNAQFADVWSKLATQFKGFPNVIFGLMNEPYSQPVATWLTSVNAAIAAIRATGATNLITVPGISFTGAWTWLSSGNAATMIGVVDPGNNFIYEVHQYFDIDGSGQHVDAVSATIGSERLQAITGWARQNGAKLLLGEFGAANNPMMLACLADCARYMNSNPDVWAGWTYWSGGPRWGPYIYSIEPPNFGQANQADAPQMTALAPYLSQS